VVGRTVVVVVVEGRIVVATTAPPHPGHPSAVHPLFTQVEDNDEPSAHFVTLPLQTTPP